ncbi:MULTISPECIES: hypothetical protein [Cyanophyceae]|uniref:hypothetical protein n=1 Tax=Cyanophyceae TaxID=3028117 RepID=UPI00168A2FF2|nr:MULTISPECIES: hypothetical protein [Cyanophyceae]MBD1918539.1 hypothetical protein [Phormidium sp. FACHB-77]MBD2031428.1 hypothetical protein [Phormidium sp. FACHB-322]MBD2049547.1 hypothetical protein [Leptolyngbya sp. FACHB-60]
MRPQDPNFPSEIPPIPPPRHTDQSGQGDADPSLSTSFNPSAEAEGEAVLPQAIEGEVVRLNSQNLVGEDDPAEPVVGDRETYPKDNRASGQADDTAPYSTAANNGRSASLDAAPWTDSDLENLEDPLPVTAPEPQPIDIDRRQMPNRAVAAKRARPMSPAEDVWADTGIPYQPKELGVVDQLLLLLAEGATLWKKGLRWVRSQLPPDLQRKLSDGVLTAIALGLLMLLLALWNPLGARRGEPVVASEPLPQTTAAEPDVEDPFAAPVPTAERAAVPAPAPVVEPTPEQSLITDIQNRVSSISRSYGAGLIQSVEVNLPENTLGVNVAEAWYGLLGDQQNEIAQDIYAQAQGLKFGTLQLRDPEGVVVARNPVVGPNIVILRRLRSTDADWRTQ